MTAFLLAWRSEARISYQRYALRHPPSSVQTDKD